MLTKVDVTSVVWDAEEDANLPSNFILEVEVDDEDDIDEIDEMVSNAISDEYGYCHYGFEFVVI